MSEQAPKNRSSNEQYHLSEVTESIKDIFELSTRIDERVQLMIKRQDDLEHKIDQTMAQTNDLAKKIAVLESSSKQTEAGSDSAAQEIGKLKDTVHVLELKVQDLQGNATRHDDRWKGIVNFVVQVVWAILAAFLLIKLGLQKP